MAAKNPVRTFVAALLDCPKQLLMILALSAAILGLLYLAQGLMPTLQALFGDLLADWRA